LYLPGERGLKFLSFGYQNILSDLLWFKTVSYFGKHYASDRDYTWLKHMCKIVSTLDPRKQHVYEFCSTMLAWEVGNPKAGIEFLSAAIAQFPRNWHLYFLRGFNYLFFLDDPQAAQNDFVKAASLPNAEPIAARLAAKSMIDTSDPETAISFLAQMISRAKEPAQRKALEKRLKEAAYERDLRRLEGALEIFATRQGRRAASLEELVSAGIVKRLPKDPFSGDYYLDTDQKTVKSTSNKKRLSLYTKKTAAK